MTAIASFEAAQPLILAAQSLEASREAARRIFELLDADPAVEEPPEPTEPHSADAWPENCQLEVRNLRFAYASDEAPALDGVSFVVPAGGRVAIVGPSGAGKSTLVSILLRFWDYSAGSIELGGRELRAYHPDTFRALMSVVAQDNYLFTGSIRDNLLLANPDATDEQIVAACRRAQLHEFIQRLPHDYDTWVGEDGLRLSGGERQRLAIARALLKDAPILILDEATTHLDAVTAQAVWEALNEFMVGRTTVIIAHDLRGIPSLDRVLCLDQGRLVAASIINAQTVQAS